MALNELNIQRRRLNVIKLTELISTMPHSMKMFWWADPHIAAVFFLFQLSDIFYNTLGGFIGGMLYYAMMKVKKL